MANETALYMKFPCVLRDKLLNGELHFPPNTRFAYEKIFTYRAVERKKEDFSPITREDFRSYFELGKKPKPRGVKRDILADPTYYGVSSFLNQKRVEQLMKFPNPNKKWHPDMYTRRQVLNILMKIMYVGGFLKMQM
ncbi:hypothetical protein ACR742_02635 [Flavonifractor plautii]|uniref:hypothetical protein n=1 Tax=Flavonifractor plautii TaxID=292800 RepID=UPI003DA4D84C